MAKFMIICDHTAEDCEALDEELQRLGPPDVYRGKDFQCSCPYGHHAGWVAVEGESAESILAELPPVFGSHANVYQIETMVF
jgi:hypothetical protein